MNTNVFNNLMNDFADAVAEKVLARLANEDSAKASGQKRLLKVPEVAARLGRSEQAVYHLIGQGRLVTVRMDRRVFVDSRDLEKFIQAYKIN